MAGLLDPGVRDRRYVLPGCFVELAPEIVGGRVRLGVAAQIAADAFAEYVLAQVALDHAKDRRALRVGDGVKALGSLIGVLRLDRDRMRRGQRVQVERAGVLGDEVTPEAPLGVEGGGRLFPDEAREGLVEPEIRPPLHR